MVDSFDMLLKQTVAPIVLISGIGMVMVSLNNRYMNATAKTRIITGELMGTQDKKRQSILKAQVLILLKRCNILRLSITMVVASIVVSSTIVMISATSTVWKFNTANLLTGLLFTTCACIMLATLLLLLDIVISLRALKQEVQYTFENLN